MTIESSVKRAVPIGTPMKRAIKGTSIMSGFIVQLNMYGNNIMIEGMCTMSIMICFNSESNSRSRNIGEYNRQKLTIKEIKKNKGVVTGCMHEALNKLLIDTQTQ